jgi:tetratricopeptide (TPR) repeat protein
MAAAPGGSALGALVPGTPAPTGPTAPAISILLLAIDEVPAPGTALPAPALAPVAPPAAGPTAAITPAYFQALGVSPYWLSEAQAKPKKKKLSEDDLFRLEPDPRALLPDGATQPVAPPLPDSSMTFPALGSSPQPSMGAGAAAPGRAQLTAVPLRRALMSLGWADIMPVSLDSTAISRAIGESRLTTRTLDSLKISLSQLAAPGGAPSAEVTQNATAAAARVGQALGYRAVVAFYVSPSAPKGGVQSAGFSFIVADTSRENGEPILFDEQGADEAQLREVGASSAAALVDKMLRGWPVAGSTERVALAQKHLAAGRAALAAGDTTTAQEELTQATALDSTNSEPYSMLGDLLVDTDPVASALAYRRAVQVNSRDGASWAKIAVAYTTNATPDWPLALEAGRKALATNFDSVPLRVAMATAQFGRADIFRKHDRLDRAEDAELEARQHLTRALDLAPDDPTAIRLLARTLLEARRYNEASTTLDRIAPRYPKDIEIQTLYASALAGQSGRESDAFAAYAQVWQLSGQRSVDVDATTYRSLAKGFDLRVYEIGKSAQGLSSGVANGAMPREDALLQLTKLKEDMVAAENGIKVLRAPAVIGNEAPASRVFAADLMNQSLEAQQIYLETGQELQRVRGAQLNVQAVSRLNAARNAR